MLRSGARCLHKSTFSEIFRQWLGVQSRCSLLHSSSFLSKKKSGSHNSASSSDSDAAKPQRERAGVDKKLKAAAKQVAQSVPKHGSAIQSDLLKQLQSFSKPSTDQAASAPSSSTETSSKLSELFSGMQVNKQRREDGQQRTGERDSGQSRSRTNRQSYKGHRLNREKVTLFKGPSLGIFTSAKNVEVTEAKEVMSAEGKVSLWEQVAQEQLETLKCQPPTNAFEEMIQWTQDGKLWHFPINNEQGMDEEARTGFHEHVFLADQIHDFPRRGPIRHFMDLVLVGLAQNPHLSVRHKHEHIDWFRRYFKEKEDVLREALGEDGLIASSLES